MDELRYAGLLEYLNFISKTYDLEICINDFTGFTMLEHGLMSVLQPYMIHKNKFCMYIKSNNELWQKCLKNKKRILDKCNKEKNLFKGICPSGVEEYIVPILYENMAIGFISVGVNNSNSNYISSCISNSTYSNRKISEYLIRKKCLQYNLNFEKALQLYNSACSDSSHSFQFIWSIFSILTQYFQELYIRHINSSAYKQHQLSPQAVYTKTHIFSHAIEYINQNYSNNITVADISRFCCCSQSYISHNFKERMGLNIPAYISKVRVEQAKTLLENINLPISHIATEVGFNDPNYFSKVFSDTCGMSPRDYRKSFGTSI